MATGVLKLLDDIEEFLSIYKGDNEYIDDRHIFIKDINTAIDIINDTIKNIKDTEIDIGDILVDTSNQIDNKIKTERFKKLLKDLIDIVKQYFDSKIFWYNARKSLKDIANKYRNEDYILPRGLLKEQLTYIQKEIDKIPSSISKENKNQLYFAYNVIGELITKIEGAHEEEINIRTASLDLLKKYIKYKNEAKLMNEISDTVFIKMTNNIDDKTLSKLVKDYTDSVLAPYKVVIPESGKTTSKGDIPESGEITSKGDTSESGETTSKEDIPESSKTTSKTNYLTILYWILAAIVVILSVIFILGLILGFIYAIRAERFKEIWSTKRVIGRTFLGFVFVAMYWNKYGIW